MTVLLIAISLGVLALVPATVRWLRVAQREHYIAPWTTILAGLWLKVRGINMALAIVVLVLIVIALVPRVTGLLGDDAAPAWLEWAAVIAVVKAAFLPLGLGLRGTTGRLAWTARLKRTLLVWMVLVLVLGALLTLLLGPAGPAVLVLLAPLVMDLALAILRPIEKAMSKKFLVSARKRLKQVGPRIVAITGSYGKTSTKGYVAHLLSGAFTTVASPASFNNLMGLSRAVNERVVPGTEVFVAEMGVYGTGEIRELSESFPPDVAAITTIGEAHLARMGSRQVIFQAKSEITEKAPVVVLPIDDPLLLGLANQCRAQGKRVITVSTNPATTTIEIPGSEDEYADVVVADGQVRVGMASAPVAISGVGHAVNVAVAVGIAVALDVPLDAIAPRLAALPDSAHRAEVQQAESGVVVVDDTYNSNPVGAARAVEGAAALAAERGGELVVVTPGMVELGRVQHERNRDLAAQVSRLGGHLFAIGRTNRRALVEGAAGAAHPVRLFPSRAAAVAAALDQASDRGVILYENDLPDHYP